MVSVPKVTDGDFFKLLQRVLSEREVPMFYPLDIFKTDSDGGVLWRGAEENLIAAKRRIEKLALSSPGEYLIFDHHTGRRVLVTPDV